MSTRTTALIILALTACGGVQPQISADGEVSAQVTARPVLRGSHGPAAPSRDGRLLVTLDWEAGNPGNLAIVDLATGEKRHLTAMTSAVADIETPRFSADGKRVAYSWYDYTTERTEYRVAMVDGSSTRTLLTLGGGAGWYAIAGWTAGDEAIILVGGVADSAAAGNTQMIRLSTRDGSQARQSLGIGASSGAVVSPDGNYLLYSRREHWNTPNVDVHVRSLQNNSDVRVASSLEGEFVLAWGPQGVFYLTREGGSPTVWLQRVDNGRPAGTRQKVMSEVWGISSALGVGGDRLFYEVPTRDMQVMQLDLTSPDAPPTPVSDPIRGDWVAHARWSPDGSLLAYARREFWAWTVHKQTLTVRDAATRQDRVIPTPLFTINDIMWHPDGRSVFLMGTGYEGSGGRQLHRFDLATGEFRLVATGDTVRFPRLSRDGSTEFKVVTTPEPRLVAVNLATGAQRTVWTGRVGRSELSPDGARIAFIEPAGEKRRLRVMPVAGGDARVLHEWPDVPVNTMVWTADGSAIVLALQTQPTTFVRVPLDGTAPQTLLHRQISRFLAIHPDGRRLVFITTNGQEQAGQYGVWSIDNLSSLGANR